MTGDLSSVLTAEAETKNLLGSFYGVKLDCVPKDFVRRRFVLAIFAIRGKGRNGIQ